MEKLIRRRIKTNIRQAKTKYKFRALFITLKIILRGEFTRKSFKFYKKLLLGSPRYAVDKCVMNEANMEEKDIPTINEMEKYARQMAGSHAFLVDKNFWMVVKEKPKWMPDWLYKAVIKDLIEFQEHR